jgi:hypothetical protein
MKVSVPIKVHYFLDDRLKSKQVCMIQYETEFTSNSGRLIKNLYITEYQWFYVHNEQQSKHTKRQILPEM